MSLTVTHTFFLSDPTFYNQNYTDQHCYPVDTDQHTYITSNTVMATANPFHQVVGLIPQSGYREAIVAGQVMIVTFFLVPVWTLPIFLAGYFLLHLRSNGLSCVNTLSFSY